LTSVGAAEAIVAMLQAGRDTCETLAKSTLAKAMVALACTLLGLRISPVINSGIIKLATHQAAHKLVVIGGNGKPVPVDSAGMSDGVDDMASAFQSDEAVPAIKCSASVSASTRASLQLSAHWPDTIDGRVVRATPFRLTAPPPRPPVRHLPPGALLPSP